MPERLQCEFCKTMYVVGSLARDCEDRHIEEE